MRKSVIRIPKNLNDYLCLLLLMFCVFTLIQGILPISVNRLIAGAIIILLLIDIIKHLKRRRILNLYVILLALISIICFSTEIGLALKDWVYFTTTMLFLDYLIDGDHLDSLNEAFCKYSGLIKFVIYIMYGVTLFSIIIPANYNYAWGSSSYFMGFARDTHVMASSSCLLMAFMFYIFQKDSFSYFKLASLTSILYVIFETGARTYIVPSCLICYLYVKENVKDRKKQIFIELLAMLAIFFIFERSGMLEKFLWSSDASNQYTQNDLVSSSGGRAAFWLIDIQEFARLNPLFKLIGRGFDYVYQVNYKYYNLHIWAHNDLIDLLLSTGLIGLISYMINWFKYITKVTKNRDRIIFLCFCLYALFPMFFNGMFTAQHFFLSVVVLSLILNKNMKENSKMKG